MDDQSSSHPQVSWTWADMFLTYRFWGLLLFYLFSLASSGLVSTWLYLYLQETSPANARMSAGLVSYALSMSALLGFYLAWAATRRKAKTVLLAAGVLLLVGGLLLTFDALPAIGFRVAGAVLFGIGVGTISLGVPAILAGGRGGAQAFVIAFGLLFTMTRVSDASLTAVLGSLWDHFGSGVLAASTAILALLGLLALLPVNPALFTTPPRARAYSWPVRPRSAVLVGFGSVIGLISYYLLYRFHGEVASLRPSSKILSPGGALWTVLLFPWAFAVVLGVLTWVVFEGMAGSVWPLVIGVSLVQILLVSVVMTTLVEPLNELAAERGRQPLIAPWVVFVFSVLFLPVAMALIQRALNQSIAMAGQDAA